MKLTEQLTVIAIVGILATISINQYLAFLQLAKLNIAINYIVQSMRQTRYEAIGGTTPKTLCISPTTNGVAIGPECSNWVEFPVKLDLGNSTLRTSTGIAGNSNSYIYRASFADTAAGLGGSWGQLGRVTLQYGNKRKCVFLADVGGTVVVKEGLNCIR